jgi:hypothetical protein
MAGGGDDRGREDAGRSERLAVLQRQNLEKERANDGERIVGFVKGGFLDLGWSLSSRYQRQNLNCLT